MDQNGNVSQEVFKGRKELCDERFARDKKRLEITEEGLDRLTALVTELAGIVKANTERGADHETRIRDMESKGGKWFDKIIAAAIGAAVTGIIAYLLSAL